VVEIVIPYDPREHQAEVHKGLERFNVLVCHRRFGKTVAMVNELIMRALKDGKKDGRYGYIAPFYKQAKTVAWDYLKHYTDPIPGRVFNESELRVDFLGQRIRLFGGDNPDALRGIYLDGVILDEYAEMDPRVWSEIIRPALSDRKGWAVFIGTPKGKNAFYDIYQHALKSEGWLGAMYKASETGIVDAAELVDARAVMTPDEYEQEYECSFEAAIKGAYYGPQMALASEQGRIGSVPYQSEFAVDTFWDLGIDDSTAIWFVQYAGKEIHLVDYYENNGEALAHYVGEIEKRVNKNGCRMGDLILPHDARQRELSTGLTRQETLEKLGCKTMIAPSQSVVDGINAARQIMGRCWWDAERCERGIESLRQYAKDYDSINRTFRQKPLHNWASHGADAFRYGAITKIAAKAKRAERSLSPKIAMV